MPTAIKLVEPAESELLAGLEAKTQKANLFFRAMAHRPEALKNFGPFYSAIVGPGAVERRIKELVYLTGSYENKCAFCTAAHTASGRKAGITEEEMRALQTGRDDVFSAPERAAIRFARELAQTASAADSRATLVEHFTAEQVVEITLVAAMANFTNRFNNALGIEPQS
jgi:uncharacterized peroxidase-related enzyme